MASKLHSGSGEMAACIFKLPSPSCQRREDLPNLRDLINLLGLG
ncbi:hypothetical protein [Undibacterium fentianense]|nr:hypothetical protein [Undibacterium fentianense]